MLSWRDKINKTLIILAMVTPPWNIFWWIVGWLIYKFSGGKKNDASGDGAIGLVLYAPITLPAWPFMAIKEKIDLLKYEKYHKKEEVALDWVASRLRQKGINVVMNGCWTKAEVPEEKVKDFRDVYAEAIKKFSDLRLFDICGRACQSPPGLLDKQWAVSMGIDEYQAPYMTAPCYGCGKQDVYGWRWGNDEFHQKIMGLCKINYMIVVKPEYRDKLNNIEYLCKDCYLKFCRDY